jgi:hypothetical protein
LPRLLAKAAANPGRARYSCRRSATWTVAAANSARKMSTRNVSAFASLRRADCPAASAQIAQGVRCRGREVTGSSALCCIVRRPWRCEYRRCEDAGDLLVEEEESRGRGMPIVVLGIQVAVIGRGMRCPSLPCLNRCCLFKPNGWGVQWVKMVGCTISPAVVCLCLCPGGAWCRLLSGLRLHNKVDGSCLG